MKKIDILSYQDYIISEDHIWITLKIHSKGFANENELCNFIRDSVNLEKKN